MNCRFHPVKSAQYHCHYCQIPVCSECCDESLSTRQGSVIARCFVCEGEVDALGDATQIEPFWSRIQEVYTYPLSTQALLSIFIIAMLSVMLDGFGLLGLLPVFAIALYAFSCLRHTSRGEQQAPGVEACFEGSIGPVFYVGISMFLATLLASLSFAKFGYGVGILVGLSLSLVVPAIIIIIAIEEELTPALNPSNLLNIVSTTGSSYFVMVLFIVVMLSSMEVLAGFIGNTNFRGLSVFISSIIANYYIIVIYHIMGYLVYQNHAALGYKVTGTLGVKDQRKRASLGDTQNAKLDVLIKAGKFDAAREIVRQRLQAETPIWEWKRAFMLFCAGVPSKDVGSYFERYVSKLDERGDTIAIAQAYAVIRRCSPSYELEDDVRKLMVAGALNDAGKYTASVGLIGKLAKESTDSAHVISALNLLISGFQNIPNGEKHVAHYRKLLNRESQRR